MVFSQKLIKSALPAFLSIFLLTFFGCANLERNNVSSVTFTINTARAATTGQGQTFIDVELTGGYSASQTIQLNSSDSNTLTVSFDNVPVGASVAVQAKLYVLYDGAKSVHYFGKSDEKTIVSDDNLFTVSFDLAYDSIAEGNSGCLILRPLFTSEADNKKLTKNQLNFAASSETFSYKFYNLSNYQKARITIKGLSSEEHQLRPKFVKSKTAAMYYQENITVKPESKVFVLIIPQGINLDAIGFENGWNNDANQWASDFSCIIEKIEFLKDSSLVDPDFNVVVTNTASVYTIKNPALQKIVYTKIDKNKVEFDTEQALSEHNEESGYYPYCAAYWEFDKLEAYDTITIRFKATPNNGYLVNGYLPTNYPAGKDQKHSTDINATNNPELVPISTTAASADEILEVEIDTSLLRAGLSKGELQAIEFKNHPNTNGETNWTLEIVEIKLENDNNIYIDPSLGTPYGSDDNYKGTSSRPFKYVDDAVSRILEGGSPSADWYIYIKGTNATGTPKGTSGTNKNYGHIELPATITNEKAHSITITGATPHSDWINSSVPEDLDTINRGGDGSSTSLSSGSTINGAALVVSTTVPVTITNLKITGGSGYNGGGILINEGATVSLGDGVLITKNRASNRGGAICNLGTLFIYGSAVIGDKDATNYPTISSTQNLSSTATANYASTGGGIFNGDPNSSTIANTTVIAKLYLGYKPSSDLTPVEQTLTGGIYCNGGGSCGGGIYNSIKSEIYMHSGTLSHNAVDEDGGAIYNLDAAILNISGGTIHTNKASQNSGVVRGGGIHNHGKTSIFILSGGSIYNNQAWADSGTNGKGGGVFNGGYMFMYGTATIGEVPEDLSPPSPATSSSCSNKANIGGGIYNAGDSVDIYGRLYIGYKPDEDGTTPVIEDFTGGIYYNYSEQVYFSGSSNYGGGGIYSSANNAYGEFKMSSGTVAYNGTNDYGAGIYGKIVTLHGQESGINIHDNSAEKSGNAIYIEANSRYYLSLAGYLQIPKGDNEDHDIYIGGSSSTYYSHIEIADSLDGNFETIVTPEKYIENTPLVSPATGFTSDFEAETQCFSVTPQTVDANGNDLSVPINWKIDSNGKLQINSSSVTVTRTDSNSLTHTSGRLEFELSGVDPELDYIYLVLYSFDPETSIWGEEDADEGHRYSSGSIDDALDKHFFEISGLDTNITNYKILFKDPEDTTIAEYEFTL